MSGHDVVIVGGGLVGASLALALAPLPLRVALVEAVPPRSADQPGYDDRVVALSQGSRRILDSMGLWPAVASLATPIRRIHVSDRGHFGRARLAAHAEGVEALGYVLEARVLGRALWAALAADGGVDLVCPATVSAVRFEPDLIHLELQDREQGVRPPVTARLAVAADGGDSQVRAAAGIRVRRADYGQVAVIANVTPARDPQGVAYERFTETGPLALLPMSEGRCSLVWTVSAAQADEVSGLDDEAFLARLYERFGGYLGRFLRVGRRQTYPLALTRAREHARGRVVVVGNAAHTLHPVAGQGFNLGLRDVAVLAEVLAGSVAAGEDPGAAEVLQRYAAWRQTDQRTMTVFTDGLVRVFSSTFPPLALARNAGLLALDLLPFAKHFLARRTMGLAGRQTRLARGLPL